jgi:hypothetical protein
VSVGFEEAHVAAEHVEKLRQALEAGVSKEFVNLSCLTSPERVCVFQIGRGRAEFQHLKRRPPRAMQVCRSKTGPGPSHLIASANKINKGNVIKSRALAITISASRLI